MDRTTPSSFPEALCRVYVDAPCAVLPNALWKTLARLDAMETRFTIAAGQVESILLWAPGELHAYWHRADAPLEQSSECLKTLRFALLHQAHADSVHLQHLSRRTAYFRLKHDLASIPLPNLPVGYRLQEADPPHQAKEVAEMIAACYSDTSVSPESVRTWTAHPTFAPDLWLWVAGPDGLPAGLGIAELDRSVPEGALEWIQVLPAHRGRGLGTAIVGELLGRLAGRARFVTVSGRVDNATRPERLYRSSGFAGDDMWSVMRTG